MPPQKRGRQSGKHEDADMADASDANANGRSNANADVGARSDSDDDSDSDDADDELTFTEQAGANSDDDDDDDSDDDMDGGANESNKSKSNDDDANDRLVNVEFVFSDPREEHFHSVKQYLLAYLPSSQPFNVSGLASLVVGQAAAGTMVCAEGESDVYGFVTALGLQRYAEDASLQQVLSYVTKRCPASESTRFQHLLATRNVGLVINERMVNMPYQLVPPLHSALHEDLEWAIANESTPALRQSFQLDYFLILSSCTMEKAGAVATASAGKGKGKGKKAKTEYAQTAKFFANFEDEFLEPEAEVVFTFETPRGDRERERERPNESPKHSVVMLIERARHKAALASIAAMINA